MSCNISTEWNISLVKGASYSRFLTFLDESELPVNLNGLSLKMIVKAANKPDMVWGTTTEEITVVAAADGKIKFALSRSAIEALSFRSAAHYLYLVGETTESLIVPGTISVK